MGPTMINFQFTDARQKYQFFATSSVVRLKNVAICHGTPKFDFKWNAKGMVHDGEQEKKNSVEKITENVW